MNFERIDFAFATADADRVQLEFDSADLVLRCVDAEGTPREHRFVGALCFKWDAEMEDPTMRNDVVYDVKDSHWLAMQTELAAEPAAEYAHYKLCFNACGVLDVIFRPAEGSDA